MFNSSRFSIGLSLLLFAGIIFYLPFSFLSASSIFDEISNNISAEERILAGLDKLSDKEKIALEQLLFKHPNFYPIKLPKVEDSHNITWVYEAKLLNNPPPQPVSPYDETQMIYDIAICLVFQNEAQWLKEWIEYHKIIGVQHFYMYNNLSTDNYLQVLEPYIKTGDVELIEWPGTKFLISDYNCVQNLAYENALQRARGKARWLAIIDADEFIVPVNNYYLIDTLREFEQYGGLTANWQMYGTSWVKSIPKGKLMIEMLTKKHPHDHGPNWFVKSIVKPHRVEKIGDPHFCYYTEKFFPVDSMHQVPCLSQNHRINLSKICINHYWTRTEDYYYQSKAPRGVAMGGQPRDPKFVAQDMAHGNSVEDKVILKYVPALKAKLGYLRD